jgi:hypothetical protein
MSKTRTVIVVTSLCCVATVGAAWIMRPHPPAKVPKECTPSSVEVYRDCLVRVEYVQGTPMHRCRDILDHDLAVRQQKLDHEIKAWPERRKDKRQLANVMRETLEDCVNAGKQGVNPDGDNSCYLTVQHMTATYGK